MKRGSGMTCPELIYWRLRGAEGRFVPLAELAAAIGYGMHGRPSIDEATANIDSFTEQAIQKALKVLFEGRTCIVIAHRLATIRDADRIIVLQQGRILEQGNHAELMATGGLYSHLYTSAHASFDDQVVATTGDAEFATRT